jgi:hypothetical protein
MANKYVVDVNHEREVYQAGGSHMNSPGQQTLSEVSTLTRAVENVFRKLIRILIGRMSLKKLQEMIQMIFVEEAESMLKKEAPGKNVPLSKLGLVTDLDTRTLTKIRETTHSNTPMHLDDNFLKGFTPGFKVLDLWINEDKYQNGKTKRPLALELKGEGVCFDRLVEEAVSARGITARSMLKRLIENDFVKINERTGKVELIREEYIFLSNDELDMVDIGFSAIASLATTVEHNIANASNKDSRFYQRGCWTYRLDHVNQEDFRLAMLEFLHEVDKKAKNAIEPFEDKVEKRSQLTAGISMFYFEEELLQTRNSY